MGQRAVFFLLFIFLFSVLEASQKSVPAVIFASGNNKFVLPTLVENFYRKYPDARVIIEYGASGDLAEAIINGVSYDIFLSANVAFAQKVYDAKKAHNPPKEYARGSLILFIPADNTFSHKKFNVLLSEKIGHITVANKKSAPYGMAAIQVLKNLNLLNKLQNKIRYSTDISTVITNVIWYDDAGFLSKSAVQSLPMAYNKKGINWIEIDPKLYSPIVQAYVVSHDGAKNINTRKFLDYLYSDEGRKIYEEFGYR